MVDRLDCSGMGLLKSLDCFGNDLTVVNVDGCTKLERLRVGGNRQLRESATELLARARRTQKIIRRPSCLTTTSLFNL